MAQFEQDEMRRDFSRLGWALVSSQLLLMFLTLAGSLLCSLLLRWFSPLRGTWNLLQGYIIIFSVAVSVLPMLSLGAGNHRLDRLLDRRAKVFPVELIYYFLLILGLQMLVTLIYAPIMNILESVGFSFGAADEAATSAAVSASLLFYSIAVAPICEEIIYRGALLRYLEPSGRWFAIFISALVFALMHGNAVQFPIALIIGMIFGYLALKHSIHLTILLHVMNNLFVEGVGRLEAVSPTAGIFLNTAFMAAGILMLIFALFSNINPLLRLLQAKRVEDGIYKAFFTSVPIAAIFLYMICLTVSSIIA